MKQKGMDIVKHLIDQERIEWIKQLLGQLGEPCKSLLLDYGEGYNSEELAEKYGYKSSDVARVRVSKCKKRLIYLRDK